MLGACNGIYLLDECDVSPLKNEDIPIYENKLGVTRIWLCKLPLASVLFLFSTISLFDYEWLL